MPWIWRRENVNERDGSVRHGTFVDARDRDEGIRKAGSSPGERERKLVEPGVNRALVKK